MNKNNKSHDFIVNSKSKTMNSRQTRIEEFGTINQIILSLLMTFPKPFYCMQKHIRQTRLEEFGFIIPQHHQNKHLSISFAS